MAEALLTRRLEARGVDALVASAGLAALVGYSADHLAQTLLLERGLDISEHRARQLTPQLAMAFELILVMEEAQQRHLERAQPSTRGRVHRLGRVSGFDVPDPYRGGRAAFERSLGFIERGLDEIEGVLCGGGRGRSPASG